jgi:hypothetical protein
MTSSSVWSGVLSTQQGRLNGPTSWSARRNDRNQWIQVDLGRQEVITMIATQGRHNFNQWVKSYFLSYSSNGVTFDDYKPDGIVKVSFRAELRYILGIDKKLFDGIIIMNIKLRLKSGCIFPVTILVLKCFTIISELNLVIF